MPHTAASFPEMLRTIRLGYELSQTDFAKKLGFSPQYISDLEHGRRSPSVVVVKEICRQFGRGPRGRREWHIAGARAHGWEV